MSVNDVVLNKLPAFGTPGTVRCLVAAAATAINPGEIVVRTLGATTVTQMATAKPVIKTDFVVGIAASTSTQTATAAGYVDVIPLVPGITYLANPTVAATWNTQAKYDALVGTRVTFTLSAGVFTINAADGTTNGCIIREMLIADYPGKVAFAFDWALSDESFQD